LSEGRGGYDYSELRQACGGVLPSGCGYGCFRAEGDDGFGRESTLVRGLVGEPLKYINQLPHVPFRPSWKWDELVWGRRLGGG
jgi:hypothetical protein